MIVCPLDSNLLPLKSTPPTVNPSVEESSAHSSSDFAEI